MIVATRFGGSVSQASAKTWIIALIVTTATGVVALMVRETDARAVVAIAGLGLAGCVMLFHPGLATLFTVFALYINIPAILTKRHGIPEIVAGAFILLLALPLLHLVVIKRERLRADTSFWFMLAFLAVLFIASQGALSTHVAINYIRRYVLEGILIYWLVINVVRTLPTLKRVIWTLLAAGALLSALGFYQELTKSYKQEFGGLAYRNYVEPEDQEPGEIVKRETSDRAQGPLNEPNRFAQILVVLLPLAVFAARSTSRRAFKFAAVGAGALIVVGMLLTLSRGAIVSLVLVALIATFLRFVRPTHLLACVVALIVVGPFLTPFFMKRIQSITAAATLASDDASQVEADGSARGRTTAMLASFHVFRDHPVLGVGPGQYTPFYSMRYHRAMGGKFSDMQRTLRAHTMYGEIAAEQGLVGLVVFLAIVGVIVRDLWRARQRMRSRDSQLTDLATAFLLAVACYLTTAIFLHLSYQRYYWFLLALSSAAIHVIRLSERDRALPAPIPMRVDRPRL